ncbi:MAG: hypothetical protein KFF50_10315 [Desulfatitalea sp.]|nr:hypothetical protein [Desulfatitalea sp.]
MDSFSQQCCYHHPHREAVVRCPLCERFFCRECVTEHDDRMLCSACLARETAATTVHAGRWRELLMPWVQGGSGLVMIWALFYLLGWMLLAIPHEFHEGAIWRTDWWNAP